MNKCTKSKSVLPRPGHVYNLDVGVGFGLFYAPTEEYVGVHLLLFLNWKVDSRETR